MKNRVFLLVLALAFTLMLAACKRATPTLQVESHVSTGRGCPDHRPRGGRTLG